MVGDIIRGKDCLKEKKGRRERKGHFCKNKDDFSFWIDFNFAFLSIDLSTLRALRIGRNTQNLIPYDEID